MKRIAIALSLFALAGCTNERAESLRAEIAKVKDERVEITSIEKARQEADQAQTALAASREALATAQKTLDDATAERDATRAAIDAETARNAKLQADLAAVVADARAIAAHGQALDRDLARERAHATWARDQAAVLAREIRPGDEAWATARRLDALAEFSEQLAKEYPGDPDLVAIAREPIRASKPTAEQAHAAAERAAVLRDRFESVYDLRAAAAAAAAAAEASEAAPETPPVGSEPAR